MQSLIWLQKLSFPAAIKCREIPIFCAQKMGIWITVKEKTSIILSTQT